MWWERGVDGVNEKEREARITVEEGESVSEVFRVFKGAVTVLAAELGRESEKGKCMVDI